MPRLTALQDQQKAEQMMLQMLRKVSIEKAGASYSSFLETFAHQATQFKDPKQAASLLEQSLKAAQAMKEPSQKTQVTTVIATSYAKIGDRSRAQALLDQSQSIAQQEQQTDSYLTYVYTKLAKGYLFIDDEATAVRLTEQAIAIPKPIDSIGFIDLPDMIDLLKNPTQKQKLLSQLLAATSQFKDRSGKIRQLLSIARIYDEMGDRKTSQTLIQQAFQQASQSVQKENYCSIAYNSHYLKSNDSRSIIRLAENCNDFSKIMLIETLLGKYENQQAKLIGKDRIFASLSPAAEIFTRFDAVTDSLFGFEKTRVSSVWEDDL